VAKEVVATVEVLLVNRHATMEKPEKIQSFG
jgi:hypothetical protein